MGGSVARYDASAITGLADGAAVSQWDDLSGNARHLLQATGANQPLYTAAILNGKPVVRFDGVNDTLKATAFTLVQPEHVFIVIRWRSAAGAVEANNFGMDGNAANGGALYEASNSSNVAATAGAALAASPTGGATVWHSYSVLFNGASSELRTDGGAAVSGNLGANNLGGLTLGARADAAGPADVDVAEVIIYASVLSTSDRQAVEGYLRTKWGTP